MGSVGEPAVNPPGCWKIMLFISSSPKRKDIDNVGHHGNMKMSLENWWLEDGHFLKWGKTNRSIFRGKPLVSVRVPSRELTYPPKMAFWRWFSFSQVGYVSSLEGILVFICVHCIHRFAARIPSSISNELSSWTLAPSMYAMVLTTTSQAFFFVDGNHNYLVVSNIFYFHPYLGKWSILTNIFQVGWNHQPDNQGEEKKMVSRKGIENPALLNICQLHP